MKTIITAVFIATLLGSNLAITESSPIPSMFVPSAHQLIVQAATAYNTDPQQLLEVSSCESSFNETAIGDHGKAYGIFQYHLETFTRFAALMGEQLDYKSAHDQAILTAFVFANYPQYKSSWSCFSKIKAHN